jgi:hypothetical protein
MRELSDTGRKRDQENQGVVGGCVFCEPIFVWYKGSNPSEPKWTQDTYFGV